MLKTLFVLSLFATCTLPASAQSLENTTFNVSVVDADLKLRNVPKFALAIRKLGQPGVPEINVATSVEGRASASLLPGSYVIASEQPLVFQNRNFSWNVTFVVDQGGPNVFELS